MRSVHSRPRKIPGSFGPLSGTFGGVDCWGVHLCNTGSSAMNGIIYLVGLVVVVLAILSFLGLH